MTGMTCDHCDTEIRVKCYPVYVKNENPKLLATEKDIENEEEQIAAVTCCPKCKYHYIKDNGIVKP